MARYIVLDFDRNEDAEAFVAELTSGAEMGERTWNKVSRVVGIFVKPGRTCNCSDAKRINYGDKNEKWGINRGLKFGWWVCERCGKPRKAGHQLVNQVSATSHPEGPSFDGYEMTVTSLSVTGIARANLKRKKKLRDKSKRK